MRKKPVGPRRGMSLVELLVGLTLFAIVGLAMVRTFTSQARLADMQRKRADARSVSRSSVNMMMSELRMVETTGGVVAASSSSVTVRVPIAMGIVCGNSGTTTVLSLMPVDSVTLASAAISGHAYRTANGFEYAEGVTTATAGGSATCNAASITTPTGGQVVSVTPQMNAAATAGTPAFYYQRIRYDFKTSTTIPGRLGLWRTLEATGATEELVAPFDTTTRFRFYRANRDTSDLTVPPLSELRGLELILVGASEKSRFGRSTPETARTQTAVFFMNRID